VVLTIGKSYKSRSSVYLPNHPCIWHRSVIHHSKQSWCLSWAKTSDVKL